MSAAFANSLYDCVAEIDLVREHGLRQWMPEGTSPLNSVPRLERETERGPSLAHARKIDGTASVPRRPLKPPNWLPPPKMKRLAGKERPHGAPTGNGSKNYVHRACWLPPASGSSMGFTSTLTARAKPRLGSDRDSGHAARRVSCACRIRCRPAPGAGQGVAIKAALGRGRVLYRVVDWRRRCGLVRELTAVSG